MSRLEGRDYILDGFSVTDAYFVTVLNWCQATALDLAEWPVLKASYERLRKRPSVVKAMAEELVMYIDERARHTAA